MREMVASGRLPGIAMAVARHGVIEFVDSVGFMDVGRRIAIRPDSILRIHSLTKPIIATAIMQLEETGALPLQDPVSRWMPGFSRMRVVKDETTPTIGTFPLDREITVRDLLTHTSGLSSGTSQTSSGCEAAFREAGLFNQTLMLTCPLDDLIERVYDLPLAFQPRTAWRYGLNFDVLGHLIELVSDQPLGMFLSERIFHPLGMTDTGFFVPPAALSRFGPLYALTDGTDPFVIDPVHNSTWTLSDVTPSGGGGLVSTVNDYIRFALMLRGGGELEGVRVLARSSIAQMTTNQLKGREMPIRWDDEPDPRLGHGYGLGVFATPPHRTGWAGASGGQMWVHRETDLVVLALTHTFFDFAASDTFISHVTGLNHNFFPAPNQHPPREAHSQSEG
jgi:CubicO group peptidase (beta-lactamase class C family)